MTIHLLGAELSGFRVQGSGFRVQGSVFSVFEDLVQDEPT